MAPARVAAGACNGFVKAVCLPLYRGLRTEVRRATSGMLLSNIRVSQSRRQTMNDDITVFVGLDVHKDSVAIAAADLGRTEPRFVGTCGAELRELLKVLSGLGAPAHTLIAYE